MANLVRLVGAYIKVNLAVALEYRASMLSQVLGMCFNDLLWVMFWVLYFTKFPVLQGWTLEDVIVLWAAIPLSWGLVTGFFFNVVRLPALITQGQLDYYLALPKDVLVHVLISQIRPLNLGDAVFGPVLLVVMVDLTWTKLLVYLTTALLAAMIWLGLYLLTGSLAFWLGHSEALSSQVIATLLHISSYPMPIFDNTIKLLLFTVLPAGLISTLPVELVRAFHWQGFLQLMAGAVVFLGLGVLAFRRGLKRYESGNLLAMRS
ncbi:MAG TPA: ABC-2 family transporter protein [Symbiobacteriaceae bacterium]|nr:ABC-2 family transporter protein [Symbiobacteriaceae bacterium]